MRRSLPLAICICLFALSTGLTLMALVQTVIRPSIPVHTRSAESAAANVDLVRHFYVAAAKVLATGDASLLDAMVAPDLTEHPARPGATSGRDGLVRSMLALRATFPNLKLVVDDVRAAGQDQVLVRVHAERIGTGVFLGRPAPSSLGRWGSLEVWRVADGQLVERWSDLAPAAVLPLGQMPISVDALGPGDRRMTLTRMTIEPGMRLPVDNGQAIRLFAVDAGSLTVDVGDRAGDMIDVARGSGMPSVSGTATSIELMAGDRILTAPEADYTLSNTGPIPIIAIVVIISNTLGGEWPLNSSAAAASWTVAAMPEALGGVLSSPAGVSARVLAVDVEVEIPNQATLAVGWVFLAPGALFVLPPGDGLILVAVDEGGIDLAATGDALAATLTPGAPRALPAGVGSLWRGTDEVPGAILALSVGQEERIQ